MTWLTKAQAQKQAERLAYHIRKYGVKVVIDLIPGANGYWGTDTFYAPMAHHIVSRKSQGLTPFYSLVRKGRIDVPGPLCNVYGGFDRVARIVTMGIANHSGKGGPWNISGFIIPRDNGRYYFLGTEFEGGLNEADWDDDYRQFMGAVNAGKLDYINELRGSIIKDTALTEHSMWAKGRKIDRLGYTHEKGVAEMRAARKGKGVKPVTIKPKPEGELSMSDVQKVLDALKEATTVKLGAATQKALASQKETWSVSNLLAVIAHRAGYAFQWSNQARKRISTVDAKIEALTEAVLAVGEVSGMNREEVKTLIAETFHEAEVRVAFPEEADELPTD